MIERMLEQKLALVNYATDNDITQLTKAQWTLMENAVLVLRPLENVTRSIGGNELMIADVIPEVLALQMTTQNLDANGLTEMKTETIF